MDSSPACLPRIEDRQLSTVGFRTLLSSKEPRDQPSESLRYHLCCVWHPRPIIASNLLTRRGTKRSTQRKPKASLCAGSRDILVTTSRMPFFEILGIEPLGKYDWWRSSSVLGTGNAIVRSKAPSYHRWHPLWDARIMLETSFPISVYIVTSIKHTRLTSCLPASHGKLRMRRAKNKL